MPKKSKNIENPSVKSDPPTDTAKKGRLRLRPDDALPEIKAGCVNPLYIP